MDDRTERENRSLTYDTRVTRLYASIYALIMKHAMRVAL
jgi:hypothetical protein